MRQTEEYEMNGCGYATDEGGEEMSRRFWKRKTALLIWWSAPYGPLISYLSTQQAIKQIVSTIKDVEDSTSISSNGTWDVVVTWLDDFI